MDYLTGKHCDCDRCRSWYWWAIYWKFAAEGNVASPEHLTIDKTVRIQKKKVMLGKGESFNAANFEVHVRKWLIRLRMILVLLIFCKQCRIAKEVERMCI